MRNIRDIIRKINRREMRDMIDFFVGLKGLKREEA